MHTARRPVRPPAWTTHPWSSPAVQVQRPTSLLVTGSILPCAEDGSLLHDSDPVAQVALTVANLEQVLSAAGMDLTHVVRLGVCAVDLPVISAQLDLVAERLASSGSRPALALVGVESLALPGALLCMDAVAAC